MNVFEKKNMQTKYSSCSLLQQEQQQHYLLSLPLKLNRLICVCVLLYDPTLITRLFVVIIVVCRSEIVTQSVSVGFGDKMNGVFLFLFSFYNVKYNVLAGWWCCI